MNEELEKLCIIIKNTHELGIPVQREVMKRAINLTEDEIKTALASEILPVLETLGEPVKLVVDYDPGKSPRVCIWPMQHLDDGVDLPKKHAMSRSEEKSIPLISGEREKKLPFSQRSTFSVAFPDGTVVRERSDEKTFIATLQKIGLQRIYESNCQTFKGYKLVDVRGRQGSLESQRFVDGYYIYVRMPSTQYRIDVLYRISELLSVGLVVRNNDGEIVYGTEAQRRRRTGLRVTFDDGTVIEEVTANATFVEAVKKIGLQRVCDTGVRLHGIRAVSTEEDTRYRGRCIPVDGFYVATFSDNEEKCRALERIAERLQINIGLKLLDSGSER